MKYISIFISFFTLSISICPLANPLVLLSLHHHSWAMTN